MLDKAIHFIICLVVFSLPFYLIRFYFWWLPFNLLEVLIGLLLILWLIRIIASSYSRLSEAKFWLPIWLIFLGATIATLFSDDLRLSAGIWKSWLVVPLLFLIVLVSSLRNKTQIRDIIISLFLSGAGVAIVALFYWQSHILTYDGRLRAFYLSPNHLAMYLSPIIILSLSLFFYFKNIFLRITLAITNLLLFFIVYLTYSYGAWLGLLAALLFLMIVFQKNHLPAGLLLALAVLLIILVFFWQVPSQKFQGLIDLSYPSLKSRLVIWQSAWAIIKDHSLIGIGPGMFQKYYLDYQSQFAPYPEWAVPQPHNLFLAFWLQTGLLGLIGFVWLLVLFFKSSFSRLSGKSWFLPAILTAAMISILTHGLIDTPYWKNDLSVIFWLIIGLSYKVGRLFD